MAPKKDLTPEQTREMNPTAPICEKVAWTVGLRAGVSIEPYVISARTTHSSQEITRIQKRKSKIEISQIFRPLRCSTSLAPERVDCFDTQIEQGVNDSSELQPIHLFIMYLLLGQETGFSLLIKPMSNFHRLNYNKAL